MCTCNIGAGFFFQGISKGWGQFSLYRVFHNICYTFFDAYLGQI